VEESTWSRAIGIPSFAVGYALLNRSPAGARKHYRRNVVGATDRENVDPFINEKPHARRCQLENLNLLRLNCNLRAARQADEQTCLIGASRRQRGKPLGDKHRVDLEGRRRIVRIHSDQGNAHASCYHAADRSLRGTQETSGAAPMKALRQVRVNADRATAARKVRARWNRRSPATGSCASRHPRRDDRHFGTGRNPALVAYFALAGLPRLVPRPIDFASVRRCSA